MTAQDPDKAGARTDAFTVEAAEPAQIEGLARRKLEEAEIGSATAAQTLDEAREADPAAVDAVQQEAAEAPGSRGLAR